MTSSTTNPIRVGVIGGGLISQAVHLPTLGRLSSTFELVALAEPSRTLRESLSAKFGLKHQFADWQELVQCAEIDAVVIASPNALHAPTLLAALRNRLHCFVEKPICVDYHDIAAIERTAKVVQRVVQVGYNKRFDDAIRASVTDIEATGASLLHADALTYDPGLVRYFRPGALLAGPSDIPGECMDELRAAEQEQVSSAVGVHGLSDELHRVFIDIYLGALVHDMNLLAWFGETTGDGAMRAGGSQIWPDRTGARVWGTIESGAPWASTWAYTPKAKDFRETLRLLFPAGLHQLELDAPYGSIKRRGTRFTKRSAGRTERIEAVDTSFELELDWFAAAIHGNAEPRNTVVEAGRDVTVLTDLFRAGLPNAPGRDVS